MQCWLQVLRSRVKISSEWLVMPLGEAQKERHAGAEGQRGRGAER